MNWKKITLLFGMIGGLSTAAVSAAEPASVPAEPVWLADSAGQQTVLIPSGDKSDSCEFTIPGSLLLFRREPRAAFRHSREAFSRSCLTLPLTADGDFKTPLKAWIFAKDKDGNWYQSEKEFRLKNGVRTDCSIRLDQAGRNFLPVGHTGAWNAQIAAGMYEVGISVYGEDSGRVRLTTPGIRFSGTRSKPTLSVENWHLPEVVEKNRMLESRFQLTRDYFNPFDPDEIEVNYEIEVPGNTLPADLTLWEFLELPEGWFDPVFAAAPLVKQLARTLTFPGKTVHHLRYPAFYGQDFTRRRHFTRETILPNGMPYWAFRMLPSRAGTCRVRIQVLDKTAPDAPEEYFSPWRTITAKESDLPGVVRVNRRNPRYFEFSNGKFFYPVGLNIHANTDIRSEAQFFLGHLPDRGTFDYDDYLNACGKNGIDLIEIWMASWTTAIEWDSARPYYYGLGRYNLAHAWKLDHLFQLARNNHLYLNLVLDSHGKLTDTNDQEWEDNPFNAKAAFARANGGFLTEIQDYWNDARAEEFNRKRNRYILARWGADPNLFAIELWSEVTIVKDAWNQYYRGNLIGWHRRTAREIRKMDQGNHLLTTHVCGDSGSALRHRKLGIEIPEFTHIVCTAYRGAHITIFDQERKHAKDLGEFGKPILITEYGGTHLGCGMNQVYGDIHSGPWFSLFAKQAGSPWLWWHDVIHLNPELYAHFSAFSKFLQGLDLARDRNPVLTEGSIPLNGNPVAETPALRFRVDPDRAFQRFNSAKRAERQRKFYRIPLADHLLYSMLTQNREEAIGWIYHRVQAQIYPMEPEQGVWFRNVTMKFKPELKPGDYLVRFYHTVTGEVIGTSLIRHKNATDELELRLPDFQVDLACKLNPVRTSKETRP